MAVPVYATIQDFASSEFIEDDNGDDITDLVTLNLLKRASRVIQDLTKTAYWVTDPTTHLPADPDVLETLKDATCAQAAWFAITQNPSGWQVGMPTATMGPLTVGPRTRSVGSSDETQSEAKYSRISPEAIQILRDADMLNQAVGYGMGLGFWSAH